MNILISNDDGINAEGIKILAEEISKIANTYVVAPDSPRSASGHAITLHKPILINDEFLKTGKIKADQQFQLISLFHVIYTSKILCNFVSFSFGISYPF